MPIRVGSRFSESSLERWRHVIVSLQNVVSPGMLKSMSSSLIARLNSLSVLNNAMSRFSSGANCSFTVCALELFRSSGCPGPSRVCSTRVFSDRLRAR